MGCGQDKISLATWMSCIEDNGLRIICILTRGPMLPIVAEHQVVVICTIEQNYFINFIIKCNPNYI